MLVLIKGLLRKNFIKVKSNFAFDWQRVMLEAAVVSAAYYANRLTILRTRLFCGHQKNNSHSNKNGEQYYG